MRSSDQTAGNSCGICEIGNNHVASPTALSLFMVIT